MQYGSIGWSVGATLGYAQAATNKRVIACIGDGSFQVSNVIRKETFVFRTSMLSFTSK
jgi:TPP-dependent 2-oxoacid decarboxylase